MPNPDAIERLHALASGPPDQGATADGYATSEAVAPEKRWPFVESPGQFAARLGLAYARAHHAIAHDNFLAAVRVVLIEEPPTLAPHVGATSGLFLKKHRDSIEAFVRTVKPDADLRQGLDYTILFETLAGEVVSALRRFPELAEGPLEGDAIAAVAREHEKMLMNWSPTPSSIDFVDDEGTPGKLTWVDGEGTASSGWSFDGVIVDGHRYDAMIAAAAKARGLLQAILEARGSSRTKTFSDPQLAQIGEIATELAETFAPPKPPERPILVNETDAVTASLLGIGKAWSAFREGSVLGDSIGWGATREAAEADLRAKEEAS